jgi:hypothetical protein
MERGGHGLPKVSTGPNMPDPSTLYGRDTPETALRPFQGWPTCTAGDLRPSFTLLNTPRHTPMVSESNGAICIREVCFDALISQSPQPKALVLWHLKGGHSFTMPQVLTQSPCLHICMHPTTKPFNTLAPNLKSLLSVFSTISFYLLSKL